MSNRIFAFCLLIASCCGCAQQLHPRIVLTGVDVLTMDGPGILRNQTLVIERELITSVGPAAETIARGGDTVIDGRGGFVLPGLIDAHIHIDHPQDLQMMALYGVTSALNMRGLPSHLRLRQEIRAGDVFAPDFLTAGDYLDGDPPDMLPMASVAGPDAARRTARAQRAAGFDFIKVYSELSRAQYRAICDEARALGISVVGHFPDEANREDFLSCPHVNLAHGEQLFKILASRTDEDEIRTVLRAMVDAGLTITANIALYIAGAQQRTDLDGLVSRPEAELIHPATFQPWRPGINRYARRDLAWVDRVLAIADDLGAISRIAADVAPGVLVAGTDMPVAGAYPGESLIAEIEAYRDAGIAPFVALSTATTNAAALVRRLDPDYPTVGVIRPGARADLVLVESNPLHDMRTLRSPRGVMLRGRWYDDAALAGIRNELRESNSRADERVRTLERAVFSGDLASASALFESYRRQDPDAVLFAQYAFFFYGFSLLYDSDGLTKDPGKAEKAVLLYDMYRQTYPEFHSAHHVYGLALEAAGNVEASRAAQQAALSILPDYAPALEALRRVGH